MAQVQEKVKDKLEAYKKYRAEKNAEERTPDQWDKVISELKSRIKKIEEDMAYVMAKK
jgi:hypothetical protein